MKNYAEADLINQEQTQFEYRQESSLREMLKLVNASDDLVDAFAPEEAKKLYDDRQAYLREILSMIDVYVQIPTPALIMLLEERGYKKVSIQGLKDIYLVALALYTHGFIWNAKNDAMRSQHGPLMIDLPL